MTSQEKDNGTATHTKWGVTSAILENLKCDGNTSDVFVPLSLKASLTDTM